MIKIGMMIGDRYEILEKIGTGGMADVYKAKCHKLNRFVAIKVLKQEFSENANFVSKFRTEAQATAGLMHPNIVNVYDVGEESGIYYIVMELVEGITLKKYIEKKARLSFKEAVSIAIQVSMGIELAHNNHIIHRDIKPQNIIISKDGKVKVTDFGIAKAATSNTITSNVMGSVHYTSPEQARGGYSDEKSDIYSLGITMFEMLTGRVPFNGETTVAIAIKHIQEELPSPREFVPEIPASVEGILTKCCQKSPDRRYQNMQELIADLKQSLMNPDEDFVVRNSPDMEGGTRTITEGEREQIKRRTVNPDGCRQDDYGQDSYTQDGGEYHPYEESPYDSSGYEQEVYDEAGYEHNGYEQEDYGYDGRGETEFQHGEEPYEDYGDEEPEDGDDYDYNPRLEKITTLMTLIPGVIICIIAIVLVVRVFGSPQGEERESSGSSGPIVTGEPVPDESGKEDPEPKYVEMPEVLGKSVEEARNLLLQQGLKSDVHYEESDADKSGIVIDSSVDQGAQVEEGSTVILTAGSGPAGIEVPGVVDKTFEEAEEMLTQLGFAVTKEEESSDEVDENHVISQMPEAGSRVPEGQNITVTVSKGRNKVMVPMLLNRTEEEGTIEAIEAGLQISDNISYVFNSEYEAGKICYQSYSYGANVDPGTVVEIRVSKGPEPQAEKTYRCSTNIMAPTAEEAPDYVAGTEVMVQLVTDDNQVLLEATISSFPQAANYSGLAVPGGTVTMTYYVTTEGTTTTDPDTGETITIPGETESRSFTRRIEFTEE